MTRPTVPFSFEVFPARSSAAALSLGHTVQHLAAAGPAFISVTYGANGSSRESSLELLKYIRQHTDARPLAHLTSIGSTRAQIERLVRDFWAAGVYDFLALRGDPPRGVAEEDVDLGELHSTVQLVQLIRSIIEEQSAITGDIPHPGGQVCIAAFPTGHPRAVNPRDDIDALLEKQRVGAEFGITQLFFHADDYLTHVEKAREAGVTIPILPGLMPVSTSAQLLKVAELAGQEAPSDLLAKLTEAGGYAPECGIDHTTQLATDLIAAGAPGVHLYTFNRHQSSLAVLRELGLLTTHPFEKELV
ncbi:methylenetetrahydrofolate reductase [Lysinibacter sp. HNR]|uniref:methylenetetrahydrofolate reductase n=1 Tax=Lysinibacter sp. HNR TaxID=3031408 RepID=UPI002434A07E|nr:methylenetetrahydrofolate reductase [Lysinibacter sp. HNR]WGD38285.1 methylenetetrahydrofolate reductase [Lysinibacter sp. HNR]